MGQKLNIKDLLDQSVQLLKENKLTEAESLYQQILTQNPNFPDALHLLGIVRSKQKRFEDAVLLIERAIKENPQENVFHNNLCKILFDFHGSLPRKEPLENRKALLDKALYHGQEAVKRAPRIPMNLNNLANIYRTLHQHDKAQALYLQSLEINPDLPEALNNLGSYFFQSGDSEKASIYLTRALELTPEDPSAHLNMALLLFQKAPIHMWGKLCEQLLTVPPMRAHHAYDLIIRYAIHAWALEALDPLNHLLKQARTFTDEPESRQNPDVMDMEAFDQFLVRLLHYRHENPVPKASEGAEPIALVGESHSLSYANQNYTLDGKPHRSYAHLVLGCKAFHLGQAAANYHKVTLNLVLNRFPPKTKVFFMFGEIDCRYNSGILDHYNKHGGDFLETTKKTVSDYVSFLKEDCAKRDLIPFVVTIPAPHVAAIRAANQSISDEEEERLVQVVRCFNETLETESKQAGIPLIDVYALSVGEDGRAHGEAHIDTHHLKPYILEKALQNLKV